MKLILTSFGLSHIPPRSLEEANLFYRMPPVSMSLIKQNFMPDYAILFLADKIIIDNKTYERLKSGYHYTFGDVSIMIRTLYDEGFIQIEDFELVIHDNEVMLQQMLKRDLKELDLWAKPLNESINIWNNFVDSFSNDFKKEVFNLDYHRNIDCKLRESRSPFAKVMHAFFHDSIFYSRDLKVLMTASTVDKKRINSEIRNILKARLSVYLSYVNANLLLSQKYDTGFHDWQDFQPFYKEKFMRIAKEDSPLEKEINNVKKLFEISFPEFSNWQLKNVIKALKDKRIADLRELIDSACKGDVVFDKEFANRVLSEVLRIESSIIRMRNIVSYATIPLGFIPVVGTPIQKIAEEAIIQPVQKKKRQKYSWFYMISELAKK